MEKSYLTLGPFLSEHCDGKTDKLSGLFIIDDFQSKREEFARMSRPVDFISSNYSNLIEDDDYLEEDGAGYAISAKLLSDKFDKDYYVSMCYPMIDDPETLKKLSLMSVDSEDYKQKALASASSYVLVLTKIPLSTDLGIGNKIGDICEEHYGDDLEIDSKINGFLVCDYTVFSKPAAVKGNDGLMATGMPLPIGVVETKEKACALAAKRPNELTSVVEIRKGRILIETTTLYFADKDGNISVKTTFENEKEKGE